MAAQDYPQDNFTEDIYPVISGKIVRRLPGTIAQLSSEDLVCRKMFIVVPNCNIIKKPLLAAHY
jgi:hypothetical protein